MKTVRHLAIAVLALTASAVALFAKPIPGPKGGRIITTAAPYAEFFVDQDRFVVVSFYDQDLKPLAPSGQVVTAIVEAKSGKVNLTFAEKNGTLVSTGKLPQGDDYNVVLQVKDNAAARPKNYRVLYHDEVCAECKRAEYACVCEAGAEHE